MFEGYLQVSITWFKWKIGPTIKMAQLLCKVAFQLHMTNLHTYFAFLHLEPRHTSTRTHTCIHAFLTSMFHFVNFMT